MLLKEARLAANLTQKQLAEAAGVNIRLVQKIEGGEAEPGNLTAKNLLALADALGIDPRKLIHGEPLDQDGSGRRKRLSPGTTKSESKFPAKLEIE